MQHKITTDVKIPKFLVACMEELTYFGLPVTKKQGRIHDTLSRGGWAGAVMQWAGAVRSAVYMTASVTCNWAGAVMQKPLAKCQKRQKSKCGTDRHSDRQKDQPTQ